MCRVLMYLGSQAIHPYDILYGPDNSLIHQSYDPKLMKNIQNLAGFGLLAWQNNNDKTEEPLFYKTVELPFFDKNLENLSKRTKAKTILAHVRGVDYSTKQIVMRQNAHPFMYRGFKLALAHNGSIADMNLMKSYLTKFIKPEILGKISGTTDSEWVYALLMSQFKDPTEYITLDIAYEALVNTLNIIHDARLKLDIRKSSPANFFITNGEYLLVTRFVYDYGLNTEDVEKAFLEYHSLWFTYGEEYGQFDGIYKMRGHKKRSSVIFASEPITQDRTTWLELPEYCICKAWMENGSIIIRTMNLNI